MLPKNTTSKLQANDIDGICSEFEQAWNTKPLTLEQFVATQSFSDSPAPELIVRLIQTEVEMLRRSGKNPELSRYFKRFPELDSNLIRDLFAIPLPPAPSGDSAWNKPLFPKPYKVGKQIGTGGVGSVWRIYDRQLERPLAGKVLLKKFRKHVGANQRLEREARLTGFLQHPGVPPIYDLGELVCGSKYLVMKLVEGETFAEKLSSKSHEPLHESLAIFEQVVQTIAYAHDQGIVHRDIKPQNIMVGKFGEVQVMDWGMAKAFNSSGRQSEAIEFPNPIPKVVSSASDTAVNSVDSSLQDPKRDVTIAGDVFGTPAYMPPEQAQGKTEKLGPTADVFSLGAVLFEILTGSRLHADTPVDDLINKAALGDLNDSLIKLDQCDADEAIKTICKKCLATDPKRRPAEAGTIAEELSSYLTAVQAKVKKLELTQATTELKLTEERKRRKLTLSLATIVMGAMLISLGSLVWYQNDKANRQKKNDVARAKKLVETIQLSAPEAFPLAMDDLERLSDIALPLLRSKFEDPSLGTKTRFRIALALAEQGEASGCDWLIDKIADWDDRESGNLFSAMQNVATSELRELIDAKLQSAYRLLTKNQPVDVTGKTAPTGGFYPASKRFTTVEQRGLHRTISKLCILAIYVDYLKPAEKVLVIQNKDATLRSSFIESFRGCVGTFDKLESMAMQAENPQVVSGLILAISERIDHQFYPEISAEFDNGFRGIDDEVWGHAIVDEEKAKSAISPEFASFLSDLFTDSNDLGARNAAQLLLNRCKIPLPQLPLLEADDSRNWRTNSLDASMRLVRGGEWKWRYRIHTSHRFKHAEHTTRITKPYLIGDRLITCKQWLQFVNEDQQLSERQKLTFGRRGGLPLNQADPYQVRGGIGKFEMILFCNWLSRKEGLTPFYKKSGKTLILSAIGSEVKNGKEFPEWIPVEGADGYRLPYSAEWQLAFHAETNTFYPFGNDPKILRRYGNFALNNPFGDRPVSGRRLPNHWGIFDMHGCGQECCEDMAAMEYTPEPSKSLKFIDPTGPTRTSATDPKNKSRPASKAKRHSVVVVSNSADGGFMLDSQRRQLPPNYPHMSFRLARYVDEPIAE